MHKFLFILLICLPLKAIAQTATPDDIRNLILDRKIHQLENEMRAAQRSFQSGATHADHLRELNSVFVTTSPKIQKTAQEWLQAYPESHYAMMANAWIAYKIAWTIRGTKYANSTYHEVWPAYHAARQESARLTKQAYKADPNYLPASDGMIAHAIDGGIEIDPRTILRKVMAATPNGGTLKRALRLSQRGWGGTVADGERMCRFHAHKVKDWGAQAFDICMIHMSYNFTGWQPMQEFAERLLRTDHPAVLDIRRHVVVKSNFYYPGWYETVSQMEFPKEEWRQDVIDLVHSDDFADLEFALDYDSRFAAYTDLEMVVDKVRPRARADAARVLEYDPYNLDAIAVMESNYAYVRQPDGYSAPVIREALNTPRAMFDLQKRVAMASSWSPAAWDALTLHFAHSPNSLYEFVTAQDLAANSIVYSNHDENYLRNYLENFRSFLRPYQMIQDGKDYKQYAWMKDMDEVQDFYCPLARAKVMYDQICTANKETRDPYSRCAEELFKEELINSIVKDMRSAPACVLSKTGEFNELMFTPVKIDVMALDPYD